MLELANFNVASMHETSISSWCILIRQVWDFRTGRLHLSLLTSSAWAPIVFSSPSVSLRGPSAGAFAAATGGVGCIIGGGGISARDSPKLSLAIFTLRNEVIECNRTEKKRFIQIISEKRHMSVWTASFRLNFIHLVVLEGGGRVEVYWRHSEYVTIGQWNNSYLIRSGMERAAILKKRWWRLVFKFTVGHYRFLLFL